MGGDALSPLLPGGSFLPGTRLPLHWVSCPRVAGGEGHGSGAWLLPGPDLLGPVPCPSLPAPRPRPRCDPRGRRGNHSPAARLLQPDPAGGAGEGTGGGGAGRAGWVSEGAAGNERGKNRCRRFPRAGRAGRPPSTRPAAAASSHAARPGRGGGGIWVTGPSRTLGTRPGLPRRPQPRRACRASAPLHSAGLKDGYLLAPWEFPSQGRSSAHRGFSCPDRLKSSSAQLLRPLNGFLLQRLSEWRGFAGLQ